MNSTYSIIISCVLLYFALTAALHRRFVRMSERKARFMGLLQCIVTVAVAVFGVMTALDIYLLFAFTAAAAVLLVIPVAGKKSEDDDECEKTVRTAHFCAWYR